MIWKYMFLEPEIMHFVLLSGVTAAKLSPGDGGAASAAPQGR